MAQLVERLLCTQDVSGSSPLTSTIFRIQHLMVGIKLLDAKAPVPNLDNCIALDSHHQWIRNQGLMVDTLALRGDEGRGYRRNAPGSWQQAVIRRSPNGATPCTVG